MFKVGDRVRVTRIAASHENGWRNSWIDAMDIFVGKIMKINISDYGAGYGLTYKGISFLFPEFVLEPEFKVGEQLLFSFMEE